VKATSGITSLASEKTIGKERRFPAGGNGLELDFVNGIGIVVAVVGVFMVVVGGVLWFHKEYESHWPIGGPAPETQLQITGHWLYNTGYQLVVLGVAIFAVGFLMRRKKGGPTFVSVPNENST
jgi:hypothetical protein